MKPFDTTAAAVEWLSTAKGVGAVASVLIRFFRVTFVYVDHEHGWMIQREELAA